VKYEAVIFDLGGTLINQSTWEEQDNYIRQMTEVLGVPQDDFLRLWRATYEDRTKGTFGSVQNGIRYICQQLHKPLSDTQIEIATDIPLNITRQMVKYPKAGAVKIITTLKSWGYKTGLVCNWSHHLPMVWNECPLASLIDVVVFSSSEGVMKPDARIFNLATERLMTETKKCLYIADGMDQELSGATKVGMKAVMIRYPDIVDSNPYREKWDGTIISSLEEVLELVK
jgi:putative hydrolase of the HAD superfamily